MNEREMFERSFQRPSNYFQLSGQEQWDIDKRLEILDWEGKDLFEEDKKRFHDHYAQPSIKIKKETPAEQAIRQLHEQKLWDKGATDADILLDRMFIADPDFMRQLMDNKNGISYLFNELMKLAQQSNSKKLKP